MKEKLCYKKEKLNTHKCERNENKKKIANQEYEDRYAITTGSKIKEIK